MNKHLIYGRTETAPFEKFIVPGLILLLLLIYANSMTADFQLDDQRRIVQNESIKIDKLTIAQLMQSARAYPTRPVASISFGLNYYFGKTDVFGYHAVNVAVHILTAVFLYLFIKRTLTLPALWPRYNTRILFIAAGSTFLWATNPVQVQAVTYIIQRMASMAGMFYVMALYFYLIGRTGKVRKTRLLGYGACFFAAFLAVGAKENAVMLPVSIWLFDFLLIQGVRRETIKRNFIIAVVILTGAAAAAFIYIKGDLSTLIRLYEDRPFTVTERLFTQPRIIIFYISLLLFPHPGRLNITHDFSISRSLFDPVTTLLSMAIIAGILILFAFIAKRRPLLSFAAFFFFINHVVESTIIPLELVFEHRNYIPSMLFFIPIVIVIDRLFGFLSNGRRFAVLFVVTVVVSQSYFTLLRNFDWQTELRLWGDSVAKAPNLSRNRVQYAANLMKAGLLEEAIAEVKKAIEINRFVRVNNKAVPYFILANYYLNQEKTDLAIGEYEKAISIDPTIGIYFKNYALALMETGAFEEAMANMKRYINIAEEDEINITSAYYPLGMAQLLLGRFSEAAESLKKVLSLNPQSAKANFGMGILSLQRNDLNRAKTYFTTALDNADGSTSLDYIHAALGLIETSVKLGNDELIAHAEKRFKKGMSDALFQMVLKRFRKKQLMYTTMLDMNLILKWLRITFPHMAKACTETMSAMGIAGEDDEFSSGEMSPALNRR